MASLDDTKVNGNLEVTGTVSAECFNAISDENLKENIKPFKYEQSILDLPIYEFDYKNSGEHTIGCLAQDLREICPSLVKENSEGFLQISETKIIYLLIEEIRKINAKL